GEATVGVDQRGWVVKPAGGVHAYPPGGREVVPVPPPVEVGIQGPCQLPGVGVEPPLGGLPDGGEQHAVFGGQPCHRLLVVGEMFGGDGGIGWGEGEGDRVALRVQEPGGGVRGVHAVFQQPADRSVTLVGSVASVGEVGGVGTQQVVEGVPAGGVFGE